ncbi:hypothetical protein MKQ68_01695 [Chitinophaga horti]|uniref:Cthe-2314-like HEPN domain-containing protein n=1 Tax=Chitinophaga horti TaxID=2920382 RepID=A0ABY6J2D2_9BACT|nr:hypothetical protein [Chitinophaga horti]UYQ93807.1 hypothetical protein MKQ68_01695 [Chitinophaga horti]
MTDTFLTIAKDQFNSTDLNNSLIIEAITSYRDLSQLLPKENLYSPNYVYRMNVMDLDEEIAKIISLHCSMAISQAYEVFENFLFDIITDFLFRNSEYMVTLNFLEAKLILDKKTIREMLKKKSGSNNKGLLRIIRKLSLFFKAYEEKNIRQINISQWFDLLTMVRHTAVHNRQKVSHRFLNYLREQKANKLFDRHFERKRIGRDVHVYLQKNITIDILNWLNSYAFLIFKGLSVDHGLSPEVPQYTPPPLDTR